MIKMMMEGEELLILSYGLGIYRITTNSETLDIKDPRLEELEVSMLHKTESGHFVAICRKGKIPSHLEAAMHDTEEFIQDQKSVISNGPEEMKDRFYHLYQMTHA